MTDARRKMEERWREMDLADIDIPRSGKNLLVEAFQFACLIGHAEKARKIHAHISGTFYYEGVLRSVSEEGNLEILKTMDELGLDVRSDDDVALLNAAAAGHGAVVAWLLEKGADPASRGEGAVRVSAACDHAEVAGMLLQAYEASEEARTRVLREAAVNGNRNLVLAALNSGTALSSDRLGGVLLHISARPQHDMLSFLISLGFDPRHDVDAALLVATTFDLPENVRVLLAAGADPESRDATAIKLARKRDLAVLPLLLAEVDGRRARADLALTDFLPVARAENLRERLSDGGQTVFILGARAGRLPEVAEKAAVLGVPLLAGDLLEKDDRGTCALDILCNRGEWGAALMPALWQERPMELRRLWEALPEECRKETPWDALAAALNRQTLRSRAAPRLKPGM